MVRQWRFLMLVLAAALAAPACTLNRADTPKVSGPSEFALALGLTANPDTLRQDGSSQSQVVILARDANGQPVRNVPVHLEISVGGQPADFGVLSSRDASTGSDGRATVAYTSPAAGAGFLANGTVTIVATPVGNDFRNAQARTVDIRLVPIVPPGGNPVAAFTLSPTTPNAGTPVHFDATGSAAERSIVSFSWDFGDGTTGNGSVTDHTYTSGGTFTVVLTVTDEAGRVGRTTQTVAVVGANGPKADFTFSPATLSTFQSAFFNASASTAASGHRIVDYAWDFGAGGPQQHGVNVSTVYNTVGTFTVTLVVTDDLGQTAQKSAPVTVIAGGPTAAFTFSPTTPAPGTAVQFDGTASTCPSCTIDTFSWEWGDGQRGAFGPRVAHVYGAPGSYNAQLTVTDNLGHTATAVKTVVVSTGTPTAAFVSSVVGRTVFVDASTSTPSTGQTITDYEWVFGDSAAIDANHTRLNSHTYANPGAGVQVTYTITLTVTDSSGGRKTVSGSVTIIGA